MILTAHQPQYLPGLRLFDKIARSDMFVYLDTVPMESSGYENRNKIKTTEGWQWLTIPVKRKGYQHKPIREVEIDWKSNWQRKHRATLTNSYSSSEHFEWAMSAIQWLYEQEYSLLSELNLHGLMICMRMLGIGTEIRVPSVGAYQGHKSDLVLDMCKKLGATKYIFGSQGRNYANLEHFEREGIEVEFQDYQHPVYQQLHGPFLENMSVVDLLMNCGPKSLEILVNK